MSLLVFSTDLDKIQQQQQQCIQIAAVNVSFMKIGKVKVAARRAVRECTRCGDTRTVSVRVS